MTAPAPPTLRPDPAWIEHPPRDDRPSRSFVSGDPDGTRIRIRYWWDPAVGSRVARVWFGPDAEGPPGHAHGGALAAVLDEAMGTSAWIRGLHVLAGTLQVVYRRPVPLERVFTVRTRIEREEGRKVFAAGVVEDEDGVVHVEATGVFIRMREDVEAALGEVARTTGRATPDAY